VSVRLYVEGGGDSKALRAECRRGFSEFLRKAGLAGNLPRIVACGGRRDASDSFHTACAQAAETGHPMLLVDSEGEANAPDPWEHLLLRDGWARPSGAQDDQCHFMVQCMEAWFLADRPTLAAYFGQRFRDAALPGNPRVEEVAKSDLLEGLDRAARETAKGKYSKGQHSFDILALIDPARVEAASPCARRLFTTLRLWPPGSGRLY
jgi:hypothetical protein